MSAHAAVRAVMPMSGRNAGGQEPHSYLTTGNVTFDASRQDLNDVVQRVEDGLQHVLGRNELFAVRSAAWLQSLVAQHRLGRFLNEDWETEVSFLRHDAPVLDRDPDRRFVPDGAGRDPFAGGPGCSTTIGRCQAARQPLA